MPRGLLVACVVFLAACAKAPPAQTVLPPIAPAPTHGAGAQAVARLPYPPTRRDDVQDVLHGVTVADPYRWLEDGSAERVVRWMREQDAFARDRLSKLPLRDALAARLKELATSEQRWSPELGGDRLFFQRRDENRERAVVYVLDAGGVERALLDPDAWAEDRSLFLDDWWPSNDGKKVAFQVSRKNADAAQLRVIDVATGRISETDVIEGGEWPGLQWTPKSDGFYYQWVPSDPALRATRFTHAEGRFHKLGDDPKDDARVRAPVAGQAGTPMVLDSEGRWLVAIVQRGWSKTDVYFLDLRAPKREWKSLVEGRDARFWVEAYRGNFYLSSTDGAPRGEIFAVDPRRPERAAWKRIVPERDDATLTGFQVRGHRLLVRHMKDVVTRIEVHELDGTLVRALPVRIGETSWASGTPDGDAAYFATESYERPREIYAMSMATGKERLWHRQEVRADVAKLVVEQEFFTSKDGTRAPMFVFRRKDLVRDGTAPLLLYGYGAANGINQPVYSPLLVPWVERGGVYVFATLRGGGEYGEAWHRAGMLRNKQNTFDDFIAAAEHLIAERYTSKDRLAARGGSWGGLLVSAVLTQRPDLFRAVIDLVPQTDMIRFPRTGLGKNNIPEFGDPDDPDDFRALLAYSPYHRVRSGVPYPAVLVGAAEADERVDAMHARKFAAALQAASTGGEVLLRVDWGGSHKGSGLVTTEAERRAEEYAFVLAAMGVTR